MSESRLGKRLGDLQRKWPDLQWESARLEECDHDVVILDDQFVFRFRCEDEEHEPLKTEIVFLEGLRRRASLPIPAYTYVESEYAVAGYPLIPGEPLELSAWDGLDQRHRRAISSGVADVVNAIHSFPIADAEIIGLQRGATAEHAARDGLTFCSRVMKQGVLSDREVQYCERLAESIGRADRYVDMSQCVVHGDLEFPHILHESGEFTGVIDFGDILIGDPSRDFARLWELGEEFVDDVLAKYDRSAEELKGCSHWLALGHALGMMEWGYRRRRLDSWQRGYRFFPEGVFSQDRAEDPWSD